jgi:hypothetical protein
VHSGEFWTKNAEKLTVLDVSAVLMIFTCNEIEKKIKLICFCISRHISYLTNLFSNLADTTTITPEIVYFGMTQKIFPGNNKL